MEVGVYRLDGTRDCDRSPRKGCDEVGTRRGPSPCEETTAQFGRRHKAETKVDKKLQNAEGGINQSDCMSPFEHRDD